MQTNRKSDNSLLRPSTCIRQSGTLEVETRDTCLYSKAHQVNTNTNTKTNKQTNTNKQKQRQHIGETRCSRQSGALKMETGDLARLVMSCAVNLKCATCCLLHGVNAGAKSSAT